MRSSAASCSARKTKRSAASCTRLPSTSCSTSLSPKPSMSSARRCAKCSNMPLRCAGQIMPPVQRAMASPSGRSTTELHSGHCVGSSNSTVSAGRCSTTARTTSESRRPHGARPRCRPRARPCAALRRGYATWHLDTVTPPTNTGSSRATEVIAPVRPTCTSIASTLVVSSAQGTCARRLPVLARHKAELFLPVARVDLQTTPSISKFNPSRAAPIFVWKVASAWRSAPLAAIIHR